MASCKFLNIGALATGLLLTLATTNVEACRCLPPGLYEGYEAADVVLHATVLNRLESTPASVLRAYDILHLRG